MRYGKLRGLIREKYGTQAAFATEIGINPTTLSSKLNGKTDWTRQEIIAGCKALEIPFENAHQYFFKV